MNIAFWAGCLFASMLCMTAVGHAQSRAQISGSVVDATGRPLVGATIALRGPTDKSAQTGAEGRFDFLNLREGESRTDRRASRIRDGAPNHSARVWQRNRSFH